MIYLTFFGLGCRNVSKVFVPEGYDFRTFFESIEPYNNIVNHNKYCNNYEYNKSIYLINREKHFDNGFLLVKKDRVVEADFLTHLTKCPQKERLKQ